MGVDIGNNTGRKQESTAAQEFAETFDEMSKGTPFDTNDGALEDVNIIGLGMMGSGLLQNYNDSAVTNDFIEAAKEGLKESSIKIDIFKLEKDQLDLEFSCVLFTHVGTNGKVYSFLTALEKTGREPLNVTQIVDEINATNTDVGYVTSDIFTKETFDKVSILLSRTYGDKDQVDLEGLVIPHNLDVKTSGAYIARYVHDIIYTNFKVDAGGNVDISIGDISKFCKVKRKQLNVDLAYTSGTTVNKVGRAVNTDFNVNTSLIGIGAVKGFQTSQRRQPVASLSGYTEFVVGKEINNMTREYINLVEPLIVLNEFTAVAPTLRYGLLALINAGVFANETTMKQLIVTVDAGPLNYLLNYGGDAAQLGEKLSFKDPSAQPHVIDDMINKHFKPNPVFCLETELYGADYNFLAPFTALLDANTREAANEDILDATSELLGMDVPDVSVLANEGIYIPMGEFVDAEQKVRDIREINSVFIAQHTNDPSIISDWNTSNLPMADCIKYSGKDPYRLKLDVLNRFGAIMNFDIKITGKAVRLFLSADYMNILIGGADKKGYSPNVITPNVGMIDSNSLQNILHSFSGAAVSNLNFGTQATFNKGFNFNQHTTMRYGR